MKLVRVCMLLVAGLLTSMPHLMAQVRQLVFQNQTLAEVMTEIDAQYPQTRIHFVYNELEDIRITQTLTAESAEEAVRMVIGDQAFQHQSL